MPSLLLTVLRRPALPLFLAVPVESFLPAELFDEEVDAQGEVMLRRKHELPDRHPGFGENPNGGDLMVFLVDDDEIAATVAGNQFDRPATVGIGIEPILFVALRRFAQDRLRVEADGL